MDLYVHAVQQREERSDAPLTCDRLLNGFGAARLGEGCRRCLLRLPAGQHRNQKRQRAGSLDRGLRALALLSEVSYREGCMDPGLGQTDLHQAHEWRQNPRLDQALAKARDLSEA